MSEAAKALQGAIDLLTKFYESPSLAGTRALDMIDAELPVLRAGLDDAEVTERGLAEWRAMALANAKHTEAARATARVAIGHLQRVLQDTHARIPSEQRLQWRRDAEDWLASIGCDIV